MNLVFDYVIVFYGNDLITSFSIPYGAVAYLEKILPSVWTLSYKLAQDIGGSVTPSTLISTDADNALTLGADNKLFVPIAGAGNKKEYYATFVYDPIDPTVPIVTEDKNDFGAISVVFDDVNGQFILTSSGLFNGDIYISVPFILSTFLDYPETCQPIKNDSSIILINLYNQSYASHADWFINSGYPIWIHLTKFVTPVGP